MTAQDHVLGRADAPVTVIEYASFTCSHCADFHNDVLPAFKARYIDTGKVRLVHRNLPTAPANVAAAAAAVAICAAPGRYFDVAEVFMRDKAELRTTGAQPWFEAGVAASGKTREQIETCLSDPATGAALQAQITGAQE
ncbi:MAG: thioredoxin domain-containing protein, partial [Candidatus Sericytochromatia bacterium]